MRESTKPTVIRIPIKWLEKISEIAKNECRTQASLIRLAIKEYLEKSSQEGK
jgi:predicted DNA-binding protein